MGRGAVNRGKRWERLLANRLGDYWRRVPGSGALASSFNDSDLAADLMGRYPWFRRKFRGEAKYGYGGNTQMTLKREWLLKVRKEAKKNREYPVLFLKMRDVVGEDRESAQMIIINLDTWLELMAELEDLWDDHLKLLEERDGSTT